VIICPNCSRENEDHYKFCLGCGTELSRVGRTDAPSALASPARPAASPLAAPRVLAPPVAPLRQAPLVPVLAPPVTAASRGPSAPPADVPPPVVTATSPVAEVSLEVVAPTVTEAVAESAAASPASAAAADAADLPFELSIDGETALPEFAGAAAADVPAEFVSTGQMDRPTLRESDEIAAAVIAASEGIPAEPTGGIGAGADPRLCGHCGAAIPEGFKFCGVCGTRYESRQRPSAPVFVPNVQDASQAPARIVVIHPDGTEGDVFALGSGETTVGRSHPSSVFSDDPFLSPRHATFYFVKGQLFARDEGSLNGIFLRIKAEVEIFHGDMFRIGQQLVRFEEMAQVRPVLPGAGDGTTVMGSPVRGAWGRLSSVVAINTPAAVWVLRRPEEHMGRERGELTFPDDGFVSGTHCKVTTRDGRFFLRDLDSTNGTYLRVKAEAILAQNDLILLGQQLFKIDLNH